MQVSAVVSILPGRRPESLCGRRASPPRLAGRAEGPNGIDNRISRSIETGVSSEIASQDEPAREDAQELGALLMPGTGAPAACVSGGLWRATGGRCSSAPSGTRSEPMAARGTQRADAAAVRQLYLPHEGRVGGYRPLSPPREMIRSPRTADLGQLQGLLVAVLTALNTRETCTGDGAAESSGGSYSTGPKAGVEPAWIDRVRKNATS